MPALPSGKLPEIAVSAVLCAMLVMLGRPVCAQAVDPDDAPEVLHLATPSERFPAKWYPRVGDGTEVWPAPVTDRPYQAAIAQFSQSGAPIVNDSNGEQVRDRFGRRRTDTQDGGMSLDGQWIKAKTVLVSDPVSHCSFHWMQSMDTKLIWPAELRVAFVSCGPRTLRYKALDLMDAARDAHVEGVHQSGDTTTMTEHLPTLRMPGYTIDRWRMSTSQPDSAGHLVNSVSETWYSAELKEIVRVVDQENASGLTSIRLSDPDPSLFYPPADFRIEVQPAR